MVRPKSTKTQDNSHHRKKKRQVRKKGGKTEEKLEVFAAETLERLQEVCLHFDMLVGNLLHQCRLQVLQEHST